MLTSFRNFSKTIYAKILLGLIIIPFVFWGMGSSFVGGNKNIVVIIDKEKYSTQDFAEFIKNISTPEQEITADQIEEILSIFIGEKLIEKEVDYFGIKLSDNSLSKLIKNQKDFKRDNKFSRIEYEKFLLKNNIPAVFFETSIAKQEKKKQLFDFIGGGILPSKFLINASYDKINQKRNIQLINLDNIFNKKLNFSDEQIKSYYEKNKNNYEKIYKTVKIFELTPIKLIDVDEFNDAFFKNIDEIDDLIMQGENLDFIIQKFNLGNPNIVTFDASGKDINSKQIETVPNNLIKKIFAIDDSEPTTLVEFQEKYFVIEVTKTENIVKKLGDPTLKKTILMDLKKILKRKFISEIISKINQNKFNKSDFDKLSKEENIPIEKINLLNQNDNKILNEDLVKRIYRIPGKKINLLHDIALTKIFLIYIDKIENVYIDEKSDEYKKYLNLSRIKLANGLFNSYDNYLKEKYKIDINYKALDIVKNYFN